MVVQLVVGQPGPAGVEVVEDVGPGTDVDDGGVEVVDVTGTEVDDGLVDVDDGATMVVLGPTTVVGGVVVGA